MICMMHDAHMPVAQQLCQQSHTNGSNAPLPPKKQMKARMLLQVVISHHAFTHARQHMPDKPVHYWLLWHVGKEDKLSMHASAEARPRGKSIGAAICLTPPAPPSGPCPRAGRRRRCQGPTPPSPRPPLRTPPPSNQQGRDDDATSHPSARSLECQAGEERDSAVDPVGLRPAEGEGVQAGEAGVREEVHERSST